ncbi:MAG TPA: hypothetical protein VK588_16895, partial [Chitinophagaceae bacterium]|nr:hypothetical protein [Chitinophagaceae bacterium]
YYFNYPLPEATEALMLTQGWVQYDHFSSNQEYECEKQFTISGNVVNLFNKPVAKTDITLLGKDGRLKTFISETETDKNGHFTLKDFPIFTTDSVNMIVRALNKKGKSFGVSVDIDLPVFPRYKAQGSAAFKENILYDPEAAHYATQQAKLDSLSLKEKGVLPEVIVNSRIKISGSKNLNPDGGADQVITQKVLETMPKQNLLDVFSKEVPGFHKGNLPRSTLLAYKINGYLVVFVIDGYNINQVYDPISESSTAFTEYEENYLKYIAAEDVVGIEIMNTKKNTFAYEKYYSLTSSDLLGYVFIEITTYSGHGAFDKKIPGMYLYRPLVPVIGKTFYSPRYSSTGNDIALPDYRSTLYWNPDIITNEKGEAEFSFYTSDNSSSYLIIVQGTDLKGGLGAAYLPLSIKK